MNSKEILASVKKLRAEWKAGNDKRDQGLPHDIPEVKRIDNLQYGKDPKWNALDLYLPRNSSGELPVIINIHGGGWFYGTKETYQFYGLNWAKHGFAFVNPNYTLGPDAKFPQELDEVNEYIHWVSTNAQKYNLDQNNAFLIGDSAGGQMAEQYNAILTNQTYRAKFAYTLTNLKFRAMALNSPSTFIPTTPETIIKASLSYFDPELMKKPENQERMNVEKYINQDFVPTFIATANRDFIHDCSVRLDGFLRAKGIEHIEKSWGTDNDPRYHDFMINQKDKLALQVSDEEAAFFRKHLNK